jgi:hypothetical protein
VDDDSMDEGMGEDVDLGTGVETDVYTDVDVETDIDAALPEPATWARPASTGVASVDAAIGQLARLDELPTSEHVAVYDDLHRQLQDALADLDGS